MFILSSFGPGFVLPCTLFTEVSEEKNPFFLQILGNSHFTANAEMGQNMCLLSNVMHLVVHMH